MIPRAYTTAWRATAPWIDDDLVEQDLVLSRALVELFSEPAIAEACAFRGGTALTKLHLQVPLRYSEDIDLVQVVPGGVRGLIQAIQARLDPWLGSPKTSQADAGTTMVYAFESESESRIRRRLKIEINTREHVAHLGYRRVAFAVDNPWFTGRALVNTFCIEELLATKLRALYQRKKGRDLFDLWIATTQLDVRLDDVVSCFARYTEKTPISRAQFERNLADKFADPRFAADIQPLLAPSVVFEPSIAQRHVLERLVARLPGAPWKGRDRSR